MIGSRNTWGWVVLCVGVVESRVGLGVVVKNEFSRCTGVIVLGPTGIVQLLMMSAYPSWWLSILHARRAGHLRADRVRPPYLGQLIDRWSSRQEARCEAPCCSV
jgi:hypothetical protein